MMFGCVFVFFVSPSILLNPRRPRRLWKAGAGELILIPFSLADAFVCVVFFFAFVWRHNETKLTGLILIQTSAKN